MASFSLSAPLPGSRLKLSPGNPLPAHVSASSVPPSLPKALIGIENSGVIACLRAEDAKLAMKAARAALDGGVSVLEIVMSTPGVLEVVQELLQDHPSMIIGVGTVLNAEDARSAVKAGAKFLMSPATVKEILFDIQGGEVLCIPGVMTPTEVLSAYIAGARIVKVYPVSMLGGAQYISVLKKPFSHIPLVASQGITLDSMETYIDRGATAVVLSDAIFEKEAMLKGDFDTIYTLSRRATLQGIQAINRIIFNGLSIHDWELVRSISSQHT